MRLFDKKEVAEMLHCSVSKIEKMMAAREITFKKIGTLVRFRESDLAPFFEGTPLSSGPVSAHSILEAGTNITITYEPVRTPREPLTFPDAPSLIFRIRQLQALCSGDCGGYFFSFAASEVSA